MNMQDMPAHLIRRLHQRATHVFQDRMQQAGFDVTPVQFAAMQALRDNPGIDQAQLAALIAYDRATIGGVVDRLEQKGYVTRVVSQRDRRAREVSLSATGQTAIAALMPLVQALQTDVMTGLDDAELARFNALAKKVLGLD